MDAVLGVGIGVTLGIWLVAVVLGAKTDALLRGRIPDELGLVKRGPRMGDLMLVGVPDLLGLLVLSAVLFGLLVRTTLPMALVGLRV